MLFRVLSLLMLFGLAFSGQATADSNLAMAVTTYPQAGSAHDPLHIDRVVVHKAKRRLDLISGDKAIRSFRISLGDNPEGHKLFEGDERTPEGEYTLDWRNAGSRFYKSLHVSYPNAHDRQLASDWGLDPGGQIMIHGLPNDVGDMAFAYAGLDWTDGCIAVNNEAMDQIWSLVQDGTPIRILP